MSNLLVFGQRVGILRDKLFQTIVEGVGEEKVKLNGHPEKRLPNTLNISFTGKSGEKLLVQMPEIAASTGSACHSWLNKPLSGITCHGSYEGTSVGSFAFEPRSLVNSRRNRRSRKINY